MSAKKTVTKAKKKVTAAKRKVARSSSSAAPVPDEVMVDLVLENQSDLAILEYWVGHNTTDAASGAEMFWALVSIADEKSYTVGRIKLKKKTKDYWLLYWRDGRNNLNCITKQWFKAEAQRPDGTIVMYLNPVGGKLILQQGGEKIGSQDTTQLAPGS